MHEINDIIVQGGKVVLSHLPIGIRTAGFDVI
jgi:hypothetical protein